MSTTVTGASGTTYITGTGTSGFDSSSLIQAAVEAKMAGAYRIDDQIDVLDAQVSAWQEMRVDLGELSDAAEALSSDADTNVFAERSSYLSSSSISNPDSVLGVTVTDEAELGIYTVDIVSLATTEKVASDEVASKTDALGYDGVFSLAADDGTAAEITVTSDMTLAGLASAINAVSGTTNVTATLVKSSDAGYTLVLTSVNTGQGITATAVSGDDVLQSIGVTDADGAWANELQAAGMAEITIDGMTVTSASNDIEDVLPGVSISLYTTTAGSTITLEVGQDLDSVSDAITAFVDAYNQYRTFALTNQETDENGAVEDAVLFGDNMLRTVNTTLYGVLGKSIEVDGETYTLSSLGITYADDNSLEIDSDTLETMLIQHPDVVQAFFQQATTVSNADLYVATMPGDLDAGDYTVAVTMNEDGSIASATINGTALNVNGQTLTGTSGSEYEGMRLVYTGTTSASVTMGVTEGLGDVMVAALDTYADADDGLIADRISSLNDTIDTKQSRRDLIASQADDYEDYLTTYYAKIEAAIEASELALKQVEALFDTGSDD